MRDRHIEQVNSGDAARGFALKTKRCPPPLHGIGLIEIAGQAVHPPRRFHPDRSALARHRREVIGQAQV